MDPSLRVITELPLRELWNASGPVVAHKLRDLSESEIREILQRGPVQFMIANIGEKPKWISESDCFVFWKNEAQIHLADPNSRIELQDFPDEYAYWATEWKTRESSVVVLQCAH